MKQYVIDQLRESDHEKILEFLQKNADASEFGDIFWILLPEELYSDTQSGASTMQALLFCRKPVHQAG